MLRTLLVHHQGFRGSTENTTNISTRCSNLLYNNSIRYTHSFYTAKFLSVFPHTQQIKILSIFYTIINILPSDGPVVSNTCSLVFVKIVCV